MDSRLRKMAKKAGLECPYESEGDTYWDGQEVALEAFARLIAADCADTARKSQGGDGRKEARNVTASRIDLAIRTRYNLP